MKYVQCLISIASNQAASPTELAADTPQSASSTFNTKCKVLGESSVHDPQTLLADIFNTFSSQSYNNHVLFQQVASALTHPDTKFKTHESEHLDNAHYQMEGTSPKNMGSYGWLAFETQKLDTKPKTKLFPMARINVFTNKHEISIYAMASPLSLTSIKNTEKMPIISF